MDSTDYPPGMTLPAGDAGVTVWLTGLPCSGKSTVARALETRLRGRGYKVEVLDGDEVRKTLSEGLGFSREDRITNIRRIAYVCRLLSRNGIIAIAAAISPYRSARDEARDAIAPRFLEVFLNCPVSVCMARDVKGMYLKAMSGQLSNFTGVNAPYEPPMAPEVVLDTDTQSVAESVSRILQALQTRGYVSNCSG